MPRDQETSRVGHLLPVEFPHLSFLAQRPLLILGVFAHLALIPFGVLAHLALLSLGFSLFPYT